MFELNGTSFSPVLQAPVLHTPVLHAPSVKATSRVSIVCAPCLLSLLMKTDNNKELKSVKTSDAMLNDDKASPEIGDDSNSGGGGGLNTQRSTFSIKKEEE